MNAEKEIHKGLSVYGDPILEVIVKVKVPKNPSHVMASTPNLNWIQAHVFEDRNGKKIGVDTHLRSNLKIGDLIINRNFYVPESMCGKMIVARATVVPKNTILDDGTEINSFVVDYHPALIDEGSSQELKLREKSVSDDLQVPGTDIFVGVKDDGYVWYMKFGKSEF